MDRNKRLLNWITLRKDTDFDGENSLGEIIPVLTEKDEFDHPDKTKTLKKFRLLLTIGTMINGTKWIVCQKKQFTTSPNESYIRGLHPCFYRIVSFKIPGK